MFTIAQLLLKILQPEKKLLSNYIQYDINYYFKYTLEMTHSSWDSSLFGKEWNVYASAEWRLGETKASYSIDWVQYPVYATARGMTFVLRGWDASNLPESLPQDQLDAMTNYCHEAGKRLPGEIRKLPEH